MAREIDSITVQIAGTLPLDKSIEILIPVIATGEFPTNLCAIKILTELANKQGDQMTEKHLGGVMSFIAKVRFFWYSVVGGNSGFILILCVLWYGTRLNSNSLKENRTFFFSSVLICALANSYGTQGVLSY